MLALGGVSTRGKVMEIGLFVSQGIQGEGKTKGYTGFSRNGLIGLLGRTYPEVQKHPTIV